MADLVRQSCPEVVCSAGTVADTHVQAWLVGSGHGARTTPNSCSAPTTPWSPACRSIADAGALPALPDVLGPQVVLTPHAGELAALLERLGADLRTGPPWRPPPCGAVRQAAGLTEATVLLKGATTLVASPFQDFYSQADGTPWLATAGSGDVLAGVIGALLAQVGPDVGRFRDAGIDPDERGRRLRPWRRASTACAGAGRIGRRGR